MSCPRQVDLLEVDALGREQPLGPHAEGARLAREDGDVGDLHGAKSVARPPRGAAAGADGPSGVPAMMPAMASYDTDAVVLRSIRYSEADAVLALYTRERGRASAIVKGARRTTSRLGGRLQPGVCAHVSVHLGRGDLGTVRAASVIDAHAGLWVAGHRLQAAGCVLETVMRVMPEEEPDEEAWHLLARTLDLLARAPDPGRPRAPRPAGAGLPGEAPGGQRPAADAGPLRPLRRAAAPAGLLGRRRRRPLRRLRAPAPTRSPRGRSPPSPPSSAGPWPRRPTPCRPRPRRASSA